MAMSIRTNVASLNAQRALFNAGNDLSKSMQRLSSGYRINSSADDAAGMAISTKMQAQIGGLNQASMNAQDGISMIQTAEGALDEVTSGLQRMRDLSVQAANSTLSDTDRGNINQEIQALYSNINNISTRTQFNGQGLLNGSLSTSLATGTSAGTALAGLSLTTTSTAAVTNIDVSHASAGKTFTLSAGTTSGLKLSDGTNTVDNVTVAAIGAGGSGTLDFGSLGVKITVSSAPGKAAADVYTDLAGKTVATATGSGAANFQVGANASQTESATFFNTQIGNSTVTSDTSFQSLNTAITAFGAGGGATIANANTMLTAIDGAISSLVSNRAALGASQNSLTHTMNNLKTTSDNLSSSNSRIRDVDVAAESAAMTRAQIISQSSVSVLAQANQMPQLALKLLG
jgi:flagellin